MRHENVTKKAPYEPPTLTRRQRLLDIAEGTAPRLLMITPGTWIPSPNVEVPEQTS